MSELTQLATLTAHTVEGVLGEGGMGRVMAARDLGLDRAVAIKVLRPELRDRPDVVARFIAEARLSASLEHPNILPVHAIGRDVEGAPVLTMKRIVGSSLYDALHGYRKTPSGDALDEFVDVLLKVCDALGRAHANDVVHADIKARNIMLGEHGAVYLVDWGNARAFGEAAPRDHRGRPEIQGTPAVMAPEQARGEALDARTDVFGVGTLLYTILGRRVPYGRGGPQARIDAAREGSRKPLSRLAPRAPVALVRIAERAMAQEPDARFQTIEAFRDALLAYRRRQVEAPSRTLVAGETLIRIGDPSEAMYIVQTGHFEVSVGEGEERQVLQRCGPGDILGEVGLFAGDLRTATVVALEDATVQEIDARLVQDELDRLSTWMRSVIDHMSRSLHSLHMNQSASLR